MTKAQAKRRITAALNEMAKNNAARREGKMDAWQAGKKNWDLADEISRLQNGEGVK